MRIVADTFSRSEPKPDGILATRHAQIIAPPPTRPRCPDARQTESNTEPAGQSRPQKRTAADARRLAEVVRARGVAPGDLCAASFGPPCPLGGDVALDREGFDRQSRTTHADNVRSGALCHYTVLRCRIWL
jgi:hypothetical protein